ncbi:hypothetical protein HAV15_000822 [Penicillium sp. str. |nr:hypothetical protein HAV15_000822 [Penicillium sp. str. \
MSDKSSSEEGGESDGVGSEGVCMGYDEASESDVEPSLQSRRSVPPNDDHQEKVKMETMSGTRQEGSPGSSTGCLTEIILPSPHSAPNPDEPLGNNVGFYQS